ncbi:MAG: hypothetical protein U9N35_00600, partial [Euryarchaeota archaeon]|nr:hypothetical protein [Euryarchaeota archaeon]
DGGYFTKECAEILENGIQGKEEIYNFSSFMNVINPIGLDAPPLNMMDRFYKKNFSVLPTNHKKLSNLDLAEAIIEKLPKFDYAGSETFKALWEDNEAACQEYAGLFNNTMNLAGRRAYGSRILTPEKKIDHFISTIPINSDLIFLEPTNGEAYKNINDDIVEIYQPFLDGQLLWKVYDKGTWRNFKED